MNIKYDLAIVGAGITGANVAYLASLSHPDWKIIIVDQFFESHGASFYSAGTDFPIGRGAWHSQLTKRSRFLYQEYRNKINLLAQKKYNSVFVCAKESLDEFKHKIVDGELDDNLQIEPEFLVSKKLKFSDNEMLVAHHDIWVSNASQVIKQLLMCACKQAELHMGFNVRINKIKFDKSYYLFFDEGYILADRVISCLGPWQTFGNASEFQNTTLKKIVALHIDIKPLPNDPIIYFCETGNFLLPLPEQGYWLFSFTSHEWNCSPNIYELKMHSHEFHYAKEFLAKYSPQFSEHIFGYRVFCDAYAPNRVPLLFNELNTPQHVIIGGGSGSGYRLAPALAEEALTRLGGSR